MTVPPLETRICVWDDKTGQMIEVYVANGNRDSLPDAVRRATNDAVNPDLAPVVISKDGGG